MAHYDIRTELARGNGADRPEISAVSEPSLGDLFKQLSTDAAQLVVQETSLAKAELKEVGATLARDAAKLGIALGLGLAGALAFTAFLIVALGDLIDNYWLSALLVAVPLLAIGGILARNAVNDVKRRGLKPVATIENLGKNVTWAKREAGELKRELTA
ncbi:MAG: phage holin family protein [Gemmatimonadaceae bacterium]